MRITISGQEFVTEFATVTIDLNTHPHTFEEFDAGMKRLLALDSEEFGGHEVNHSGETAWVSRTAHDDSVEVTVFGFDGFGHDEILEYLAGDHG